MEVTGRRCRPQLPSRPYNRKDDSHIVDAPARKNGVTAREHQVTAMKKSSMRVKQTPRKLVFDSPRLQIDDKTLFPVPEGGNDLQRRWKVISEQARGHEQNGTTYTIKRGLSIMALKKGMIPSIAARVRTLTLWLDNGEDNLPVWLDTIAELFLNLESIVFLQQASSEDGISVSARMRRLYVLYRLPYLRSIDNVEVSTEERSLARPSAPSGQKVERDDWIPETKSLVTAMDLEDKNIAGAFQPPALTSELIGNQTAKELHADLVDLTERLAVIMDDDSAGQVGNDHSRFVRGQSDNLVPCVSSGSDEAEASAPKKAKMSTDGPAGPETIDPMEAKQKWRASCGALACQTDCGPRLDFNICGTGNIDRQIVAGDSFSVDVTSFGKKKHEATRSSGDRPPVQITLNMKDRTTSSISSSVETQMSDALRGEMLLSQKRQLPPSGPKDLSRRKVVASSLLQNPVGGSTTKSPIDRRRRLFQRSVRTTSVLDIDEGEDYTSHSMRNTTQEETHDIREFEGHVPGEW